MLQFVDNRLKKVFFFSKNLLNDGFLSENFGKLRYELQEFGYIKVETYKATFKFEDDLSTRPAF